MHACIHGSVHDVWGDNIHNNTNTYSSESIHCKSVVLYYRINVEDSVKNIMLIHVVTIVYAG